MTKKVKISDLPEFDITEHLDSEQAIAEYITIVLEENDPAALADALALPRLADLFGAAPSLEGGARALVNRWRDVQAGGGRDNVAAVLMQAAR